MICGAMFTTEQVARMIDHTLLMAEATWPQVQKLVDEAIKHHFACVCVNGAFVPGAHRKLVGTDVKTCSVAGFPLGAGEATAKTVEATLAVKQGADEIDFVAHLPNLLEQDVESAAEEFRQVVDAAREVNASAVVKVIIESALLMRDVDAATAERRIAGACEAARRAGCDFVKTSTGFHPAGGATVEAVKLLRKHAGSLKVKAAGGIRNWNDAVAMIEAGADRLGCSASVAIITGGVNGASY